MMAVLVDYFCFFTLFCLLDEYCFFPVRWKNPLSQARLEDKFEELAKDVLHI